jgi:hypothetical protein
MVLNTPKQYEELPYLETLHELAQFVIEMTSVKRDVYMSGIRSAFQEMSVSTAQIGLLDEYGSPKLSEVLEPYIHGENKSRIPAVMERTFWDPLIDCAHKIVDPKPAGNASANTMKLMYGLVLYSTLHANIKNMNLMLQTNFPFQNDPENSDRLVAEFEQVNPYQVSTNMSAQSFIHCLKKGVLPQLARALESETGWSPQEITEAQKKIHEVWNEDPGRYNKGLYLKPLNAVQWMRYNRPHPSFFDVESEIGKKDYRKLLPPPSIPEA